MPRLVNFEIKRLYHLMDRQIEAAEQNDFGLTKAQCGIIHFLSVNPEREIYQKDIEDRFKIRRSTVSVLLRSMENSGYIERLSVESDGRLKKIVLTEKAASMHNKIHDFFESYNGRMTENISESELEAFYTVLDKIRTNVENDERNGERTC